VLKDFVYVEFLKKFNILRLLVNSYFHFSYSLWATSQIFGTNLAIHNTKRT